MADSSFSKAAKSVLSEHLPSVRKSIIIGLGGSGISAINQGRKFIVNNLPSEALHYIRWVGMDTTDIRTSIEGAGGRYRFPDESMTENDAEEKILYLYASTHDIESVVKNLDTDPVYGNWFPSPAVYNISTLAGQGANQQRPLGRLAFFQNYRMIRSALERERDYLLSLPHDPKYFDLMDIHADPDAPDGKGAQVTVFMTGSVMGGTCSGSFLDMAALVRDVFKDLPHKMYGIYVLPQAFEKVVDNPRARANSYAALKELDYFMSGNKFQAIYPGGYRTVVEDNLFKNGRVYLLDRTNLGGNTVQDRDQVQQITSQLIYHYVASSIGGKIEERLVNLSDITATYFPKREGDEDQIKPRRRAAYNSFGISQMVYPVPVMKQIGLDKMSQKLVGLFFRAPNIQLAKEYLGDMNRGLLSEMRLHPRILFDKLFPDYREEFKLEFKPTIRKINEAIKKKDYSRIFDTLEIAYIDYGDPTRMITRLKQKMLNRYAENEFDRVMPLLQNRFIEIIHDMNRGFPFAFLIKEKIELRIRHFRQLYYDNLVKIRKYPDEVMRNLVRDLEDKEGKDIKTAKQLLKMIRFNYEQSFYQAMLEAAVKFTDSYLDRLNTLFFENVQQLNDKLETLQQLYEFEIKENTFEITELENPVFTYLCNSNDIDKFIEVYFEDRLGLEEVGREIKFHSMDTGDDETQNKVIAAYGIGGKNALESADLAGDADTLAIKQKMLDERIFRRSMELKAEVLAMKQKISKIILARYKNFDFESISIREALQSKNMSIKEAMTELDNYSRPYIKADIEGLESIELYRTVTQFELSDYETGDEPEDQNNDLPYRLDHYKKRSLLKPPVRAEMFEAPQIVKAYQLKSIGLLLSIPIFAIESMKRACDDYHDVLAEKSHPLHLWNTPQMNAVYFPDPFKERNYMNPLRIWRSMILFKLLEKTGNGYRYIRALQPYIKEFKYRAKMRDHYKNFAESLEAAGGWSGASEKMIWQAALLSKSIIKSGGRYRFNRQLLFQVKDILDKNTAAAAADKNMNYSEYINSLPDPEINSMTDWQKLLSDSELKSFLLRHIRRIIDKSFDRVTEGASVDVSRKVIAKMPPAGYKDSFAFFAYLEQKASVEFQEFLREAITRRIFKYVDGPKFRLAGDPTTRDIQRIGNFLEKHKASIPEVIVFDLKAYYGIG